jgi:glycosyltransferase involved in cell wall biosynthesis
VISVNEGGPTETVADSKTGFLVNSPTEMSRRMQFIAEHQSAATKMGKDGRKLATTRYTWDAFFDKFDPLLRKTAKSS